MGVSSVHSIAIPDGKNGQQVLDALCKQLSSMNATVDGTFSVECDSYYSSLAPQTPSSSSRVLHLYHSSQYPATAFGLLDNGQYIIADSSLDLILMNLSSVYSTKKINRIEVRGQKWSLRDFCIKVGFCCFGPSLKGIMVEIEYKPCVVPNSCWDLIKELTQSIVGLNSIISNSPNQYMISRMNEIYSPIDTIQQYNDHFNQLRKANTINNQNLK